MRPQGYNLQRFFISQYKFQVAPNPFNRNVLNFLFSFVFVLNLNILNAVKGLLNFTASYGLYA